MNKLLIKTSLCLALIFCFALTTQVHSQEQLSLSNFALPESLGKVQERFQGTSDRWVVHIQDVHGHPTAQENIAAILDHLQVVYGVSTVGVEGAWNSTSLPKSWAVPNGRGKQILARALLDEGYLTGPGYAAIFAQQPLMLVGIEDEAKYMQNRDSYLQALELKPQIDQGLRTLSQSIEIEKEAGFNPELLAYDKKLSAFRDGRALEKFVPFLIETAQAKKIDLSQWNQIALFDQILTLSAQIPKERLEAESQRLMQSHKSSRLSFEEMLRSGKIPADQMEFYPATGLYLQMIQLQDKLDTQLLMKQIDELSLQVSAVLTVSEEEKALAEKSRQFMIAKKMLSFEATPTVFEEFLQVRDLIEGLLEEASLKKALDLSVAFYKQAKVRDAVFMERIGKEDLSGNIAILSGGFHSEGLTQLLRQAGISYLVVTPDLAGEAPDEKMYLRHLKAGPPKEVHALAQPRTLEEMSAGFDETFAREAPNVKNAPAIVDEILHLTSETVIIAPDAAAEAVPGFETLPAEKQAPFIQTQIAQDQISTDPKVLVVPADVLKELLATPLGEYLWKNYVVSNKENRIILAYQSALDLPDDLTGVEYKQGSVDEVMASSWFIRHLSKYLARDTAVILREGETLTNQEVFRLKAEPVSLLFRLFLGLRQTVGTSEGYSLVRERILSLEEFQAFQKSA